MEGGLAYLVHSGLQQSLADKYMYTRWFHHCMYPHFDMGYCHIQDSLSRKRCNVKDLFFIFENKNGGKKERKKITLVWRKKFESFGK